MHRASLRSVLSTARRTAALPPRTFPRTVTPRNAISALKTAHFSSAAKTQGTMKPGRKLTVGLLSGLVLVGAWFYKDSIASALDRRSAIPHPPLAAVVQTPIDSPAAAAALLPEDDDQPKRIIAVDNESLYTGTLPAGRKVSKEVDNSGRKVVEMLTPEQATEKLRRNEESYIVGRGRGVWRYDVVQIPSNDPIEDDHAEKIIEVPQSVSPAEDGQDGITSDWMFWGVFDGHR